MPQVVIIGGGIAGQMLAQELVKKKVAAKITLVTANNFAEFPPAMPHVLCHPELHYKALATDPVKYQAPQVEYKYGVVTGVNTAKKEVMLEGESKALSYDIIVVSTGFILPVFLPKLGATLQERKDEVQKIGAVLKSANHIVVGGGGSIGLEMAGDIKASFPEKKVTLVCNSIIPQWSEADRTIVEGQLAKMGIAIETTPERCPNEPQLEACTVSGISCDMYLPSFAQGPNTGFLRECGVLDDAGKVTVDAHLRSTLCAEMFAVGCSDAPGFVAIPKLKGQWQTVTQNIIAELTGKPMSKYKEPEPQMKHPPLVLIGLGKNGWAHVDFTQLPPPARFCCCGGKGGFPFCPPPCCWPCCGPCLCGYCCGPPHGNGLPKVMDKQVFKFGANFFKGLGQDAPAQQKM
jgi:NADH dehydrogenase FAD-containing subunit